MPIFNATTNASLPYRVCGAANRFARLTGLLGTKVPDAGKTLYLTPCTGVHTFGMKYPVDVVFLDASGRVLALRKNLPPNRTTGIVPRAMSVLELPPAALARGEIRLGDELRVAVDEYKRLDKNGIRILLHWPLNFCVAALWSLLAYSSYLKWQNTGQMLGLGLMLVNTVLCVLFLTRRESSTTSHRIRDWIVPFVTVGLSMMLRPDPVTSRSLLIPSAALQLAGIAALFASLLSLGRSFGVVPANRGIKTRGLYRIVRHPVYASELVFYLGFLLGNPSPVNLGLVTLIVAGQVQRILSEERLLRGENVYRTYMGGVTYRLVPGIF